MSASVIDDYALKPAMLLQYVEQAILRIMETIILPFNGHWRSFFDASDFELSILTVICQYVYVIEIYCTALYCTESPSNIVGVIPNYQMEEGNPDTLGNGIWRGKCGRRASGTAGERCRQHLKTELDGDRWSVAYVPLGATKHRPKSS